ncbi:MAG: ABC transporter substrate-binding protein, partial [Flavobacteriia bacterium]
MRNHIYLLALAALMMFSSCGSEESKRLTAIGGKMYGGVFRFMSSEKVNNLFPIATTDIYAQRLNAQIYEPLLKLDPENLKVVPCIAESYTVSDDAKTFTFKIRKGVMFHADDCFGGNGRELTAADVKYSLEMACSGLKTNKMSYLLVDRIVGANEFFRKSKNSLPKGGI